jgi:hypothetical protein
MLGGIGDLSGIKYIEYILIAQGRKIGITPEIRYPKKLR